MKDTESVRLFQQVLGNDWHRLPAPLKKIHDFETTMTASGTARVERGKSASARLIARLFGFPEATAAIPVEVTFERVGKVEKWTRTFGQAQFSTKLRPTGIAGNRQILECFGALCFRLRLEFSNGRLSFTPDQWTLFGLPLPMALAPYGNSFEHAVGDRFHFHIEICVPGVGLVVRYVGKLNHFS